MVAGTRPLAALAGVAAFLSVLQLLTLFLGAVGVALGRWIAIAVVALALGAAVWFATRFRESGVATTGVDRRFLSRVLGGVGIGACLWWVATCCSKA